MLGGKTIQAALTIMALCWAPSAARAQGVELGVAAGWYVPGGADFDDTDAGPGTVGSVRWRGSGPLSVGVGGHWSTHSVDFTDDRYDIVGAFVEPRWQGGSMGLGQPFVGVRLAWMRESIRIGPMSRAASGFAAGGVAGVQLPVSSRVSMEAAVGGALLRFGDFTADGRTLEGTDSSGRAWSLTVGLLVRP